MSNKANRASKPQTHIKPSDGKKAFDRIEKEIQALGADEVLQVRTDLVRASGLVRAVARSLEPMREELQDDLPSFPIKTLDRLEDYALAAWYTHYQESARRRGLSETAEEAAESRRRLATAARGLAFADLLDPARVGKLAAGRSHVEVASDLASLTELLSSRWATLESQTWLSTADLKRAEALSSELHLRLGQASSDTDRVAASDVRSRAYTLMINAYDEVRRAVTYVRWHDDDIDDVVPTLFFRKARAPDTGAKARAEAAAAQAASEGEAAAATVAAAVEALAPTPAPDPGPFEVTAPMPTAAPVIELAPPAAEAEAPVLDPASNE